jgi:23S rRNA (guanosine2251-2'-O)-methyltransferase
MGTHGDNLEKWKGIQRLIMGEQRQRQDNGLVAGMRPVTEALRSGQSIEKVLVQQGLKGGLFQETIEQVRNAGIPVQYVPQEKLDRLTRSNHQGIIAFIASTHFSELPEVLENIQETGKRENFLLCDGVTDVRNFGAICRSAECFGVTHIIIPESGTARLGEDAVKTSAGALMHMKISRVKNLVDAVQLLQQYGYMVIAATEKGHEEIPSGTGDKPWCLIVGSEEKGISATLLKRADILFRIPMSGKTASLNVSVATGIALYELTSGRGNRTS